MVKSDEAKGEKRQSREAPTCPSCLQKHLFGEAERKERKARAEGLAEGKAYVEGRAEGLAEGLRTAARKLLDGGMERETALRLLGLPPDYEV